MFRKFQRKGVAVVVLSLALLAATPAHASSLPDWGSHVPALLHQAWHWLANVLPGGAGIRSAVPTTTPTGSIHQKSGLGVDPNGAPVIPTFLHGIDPNG